MEKKLIIIIGLLFLFVSNNKAQNLSFSNTNSEIAGYNSTFFNKIATTDLDGNGKNDIVTYETKYLDSSRIVIKESNYNSGVISSTSFTNKFIDIDSRSCATSLLTADLNNDKKPEIILATNLGDLYIFYNNSSLGNISFPSNTLATTGVSKLSGFTTEKIIKVEDMDGDGDKDIIALIRNSNTVSIYINNAGTISSTPNNIVYSSSINSLPNFSNFYVTNIAGSLVADIVIMEKNKIFTLVNNSLVSPLSTSSYTISSSSHSLNIQSDALFENLIFADYDNNGDNEIITNIPNLNQIAIFNTTKLSPITIDVENINQLISIEDYDLDGKKDILYVNDNGKICFKKQILRKQVAGTYKLDFKPSVFVSNVLGGIYNCELADINNDNKNDILLFSGAGSNMNLILNETKTTKPIFSMPSTTSTSIFTQVECADLDNDGKKDILTLETYYLDSSKIYIKNNIHNSGDLSAASFASPTFSNLELEKRCVATSVKVSDLTGDGPGYSDLVIATNTGQIYLYANRGGGFHNFGGRSFMELNYSLSGINQLFEQQIELVDMNSDGYKDVVSMLRNTNTVLIYLNTTLDSVSKNTSVWNLSNLYFNPTPIVLSIGSLGISDLKSSCMKISDVDGNGKMDIFIKLKNDFKLLLNNYDTSVTPKSLISASNFNLLGYYHGKEFTSNLVANSIEIGNLDDNSANGNEIVVLDPTDNKLVIYNINMAAITAGTPSLILTKLTTDFYIDSESESISIADMDNDYRNDLVVLGSELIIYKNVKTQTSFSFIEAKKVNGIGTGGFLKIADLNNDEKPDITFVNNTLQDIKIIQNDFDKIGKDYDNNIIKNNSLNEDNMLFPLYSIVGNDKLNPNLLFDGDETSNNSFNFINTTFTNDFTFILDLKDEYTIRKIKYKENSYNANCFIKFSSGDPSNWSSPISFNSNPSADTNTYTVNHVNLTTRYLRINVQGAGFKISELKLEGFLYSNTDMIIPEIVAHPRPKMSDMMGVNASINETVSDLHQFKNVRYFHDFHTTDTGDSLQTYPNNLYQLNPAYDGKHFDGDPISYETYHGFAYWKKGGVNIFPCIQESPEWLRKLHNPKLEKYEWDFKPIFPLNGNSEESDSYKSHADFLFQFAFRYGKNSSLDTGYARLNSSQTIKKGLNYVKYIENRNEQDKWWKSDKPYIYFSPFEFAAMCNIDYDNKQISLSTLVSPTNGIGVKNADTTMKMVMGGLASLDLKYIKTMNLWSQYHRTSIGNKSIFPADVINLHNYSFKVYSGTKEIGISPEDDDLKNKLINIVNYRNQYLPGKEVWLSEFGYSTFDGQITTSNPKEGNRAVPPQSETGVRKMETQGRWLLRSYLAIAAAGIDKAMCYTLLDEDFSTHQFSKTGLFNVNYNKAITPKPSYFYIQCMLKTLNDYVYDSELNSGNPNVLMYKFVKPNSTDFVCAVWCKTSNNTMVNNFNNYPSIPIGKKGEIITPQIGEAKITCLSGGITVTELPVFVRYTDVPVYVNSQNEIYNSNTTINIDKEFRENIEISNNATLTINNAKILMNSGSEITVNSGSTLIIENSELRSNKCSASTVIWTGIHVKDGGYLVIKNSVINDARVAVFGNNPKSITIDNSIFANNWTSIAFANNVSSVSNIIVKNCVFNSQNFYPNSTIMFTSADPRYYLNSGVPISNSYVNIINSENIALYSNTFYGVNGITTVNTNPSILSELDAIIIKESDNINIDYNKFFSGGELTLDRAVLCIGNGDYTSKNLYVFNNTFNNVTDAVKVDKYQSYLIRNNKFYSCKIGVESYCDKYQNYSPTVLPSCKISNNNFDGLEKAIIIAPKSNPFLFTSTIGNNNFATGYSAAEHYISIACNNFNNNTIGMSGTGKLFDNLNITNGSNSFLNNKQWDIIWASNGSNWKFYYNQLIITTPVNSSTKYDVNSAPTAQLSKLPCMLNGVTVTTPGINYIINIPNSNDCNYITPFPNYQPDNSYIYSSLSKMISEPKALSTVETKKIVNGLVLYPNPATDKLMIQNLGEQYNFRVKSISGQELLNGQINNSESSISINTLKDGIYIIELINNKLEFQTLKFVKLTN